MAKRRSTKKGATAKPGGPEVTLETLTSGALSAWFSGKPIAPDAYANTPRDAAAKALVAALNAGKRGVVRIVAEDSALARQARDFIMAFCETPQLSSLRARLEGDSIKLKNVRIVVDA